MPFLDTSSSGPFATPPGASAPQCEPHYSFTISKARKEVCLTISGFWAAETIASFAVDLQNAVSELCCAPGEHTLCCDVSNAAIQRQDILQAFRDLIVDGPTRARKLALWTSSPLSRMQSRRLVPLRSTIAVFDNEAEARIWLAA